MCDFLWLIYQSLTVAFSHFDAKVNHIIIHCLITLYESTWPLNLLLLWPVYTSNLQGWEKKISKNSHQMWTLPPPSAYRLSNPTWLITSDTTLKEINMTSSSVVSMPAQAFLFYHLPTSTFWDEWAKRRRWRRGANVRIVCLIFTSYWKTISKQLSSLWVCTFFLRQGYRRCGQEQAREDREGTGGETTCGGEESAWARKDERTRFW